MNDEKWPTLTPREYNKLERAGILSCADFIEAVKTFGLYDFGHDWVGFLDDGAPDIYMAGRHTWKKYLAMFDHVGFDWRVHVAESRYGKPKTTVGWRVKMNAKIDELIELLKEYQQEQNKGNS